MYDCSTGLDEIHTLSEQRRGLAPRPGGQGESKAYPQVAVRPSARQIPLVIPTRFGLAHPRRLAPVGPAASSSRLSRTAEALRSADQFRAGILEAAGNAGGSAPPGVERMTKTLPPGAHLTATA